MPTQNLTFDAGRLNPVTRQGRGTRQAVMQAALTQFARKGYLHARVEEITAEAGVAYGTFYKYFGSKQDVVRAILKEVYEDITERRLAYAVAKPVPLTQRAFHDIFGTLLLFYEHRTALCVLDGAIGVDAELAAYVRALQESSVRAVTDVIVTLMPPGGVFEPALAGLAMNAAVDEMACRWIRSDEVSGDRVADERRLAHIARILTAMSVSAIDPRSVEAALATADAALMAMPAAAPAAVTAS